MLTNVNKSKQEWFVTISVHRFKPHEMISPPPTCKSVSVAQNTLRRDGSLFHIVFWGEDWAAAFQSVERVVQCHPAAVWTLDKALVLILTHCGHINATSQPYHYHTNTTSTPDQHQLRKSHHKTISLLPFLKPIASYFKISFLFEREMYSKFVFTFVKSINLHRGYWLNMTIQKSFCFCQKNQFVAKLCVTQQKSLLSSLACSLRPTFCLTFIRAYNLYYVCFNPSLQRSKPNIGLLVPNKNFNIWIWIWKSRSRKILKS